MNVEDAVAPPGPYHFEGQAIGGDGYISESSPGLNPSIHGLKKSSRFTAADAKDVDSIYQAARSSQSEWARMLPSQRSDVFLRVAQLMEVRQAEIVDWLVRESGSTLANAGVEWWAVQKTIREAALLSSWATGRCCEYVACKGEPKCHPYGQRY